MEPQLLASGLRFPEGPVWLGAEQLAFVETQAHKVTGFHDGALHPIAETGGGPNGLARAADGTLFVANNGGLSVGPDGYWHAPEPIDGRIQRIDPDGTVSDLVTSFGVTTPRPNDICLGPDGRLYFTDPHNWEDLANLKPGRLWRCATDGSELRLLAEVPMFPNGIGFGPGGSLYVAQSILMKVIAFDLTDDGVGEPRDHAAMPAGFPDGFCFDADGTLYVCGSMGHVIQVFDAGGTHVREIAFPDGTEPTNCCIGDGRLYVTLSGTGQLVALDLGIDPMPLFD